MDKYYNAISGHLTESFEPDKTQPSAAGKKQSLLKPYTNNDMLNDMSIEEKAEFLYSFEEGEANSDYSKSCSYCGDCSPSKRKGCIKQWLQQKAERRKQYGS